MTRLPPRSAARVGTSSVRTHRKTVPAMRSVAARGAVESRSLGDGVCSDRLPSRHDHLLVTQRCDLYGGSTVYDKHVSDVSGCGESSEASPARPSAAALSTVAISMTRAGDGSTHAV